jgi:hypothetical protein
VIMTVCRLFDPNRHWRQASLSTFLRRVERHDVNDRKLPARFRAERRAFKQRIPKRLKEIETGWLPLAVYWSACLAHRDLTKSGSTCMTFLDIRSRIESAEEIIGEYMLAYDDTSQVFRAIGSEDEPQRFITWCRLDDYDKHHKAAREQRKQQRLRGGGQ